MTINLWSLVVLVVAGFVLVEFALRPRGDR